jgi:excisionase family DNA binding protein
MPTQQSPSQHTPLEQLYTVNGVAGALEKSRGFVYHLVREGELHPIRVGARLRFTASDVRAFLDRASETAASP